jgi:hypothetical protein
VSFPAEMLSWPKTRQVRDATTGATWTAVIEPGRLDLSLPGRRAGLSATDPDQLRALAAALWTACLEHDQSRQVGRARGRAAAHARAVLDGLPTGDPYRRYEDHRP